MKNKRIDNVECYCLKIRRTAGNVINFYNNILKPSGITVRQYSLLSGISYQEPCSISELAARTELDRSTLARSIKSLQYQNLIIDIKKTGSRDSQLILTEQGKDICKRAEILWEKAQKEFEQKLTVGQIKSLNDILITLQSI